MSTLSSLTSIVGIVAVALAIAQTLFFAYATGFFTMRPPTGGDALGLMALVLIGVLPWAATLTAAMAAVHLGSFDWISPVRGVPAAAVALTVVGVGLLSLFAAGLSMDIRIAARTRYGLAGGFALPLVLNLFLLAHVALDPARLRALAWPRAASVFFALVALGAYGAGALMWRRRRRASIE